MIIPDQDFSPKMYFLYLCPQQLLLILRELVVPAVSEIFVDFLSEKAV